MFSPVDEVAVSVNTRQNFVVISISKLSEELCLQLHCVKIKFRILHARILYKHFDVNMFSELKFKAVSNKQ